MPAPERIVLDGFKYLIFRMHDGRAMLELTDEARGIQIEAYFPPDGWEQFKADCDGHPGDLRASPEELRRVGI